MRFGYIMVFLFFSFMYYLNVIFDLYYEKLLCDLFCFIWYYEFLFMKSYYFWLLWYMVLLFYNCIIEIFKKNLIDYLYIFVEDLFIWGKYLFK